MGITIDEAINHIENGIIKENYPLPRDLGIEACNVAINTMHKYQKIEQILKEIPYGGDATLRRIQEVVEDGNVD